MGWYLGKFFTSAIEERKYRKKIEEKKRERQRLEDEENHKQNSLSSWVPEEKVSYAYKGKININGISKKE